jgi:hypothetical protein
MADPPIELDEEGELLVAHIRVPICAGYPELAPFGR